jgi:thioredoxin reductase (NADPH)
VTVLVRRDSLAHSMSDYLITQLEGTTNVSIRCGVHVAEAVGDPQLERLVLEDTATGARELAEADALFVFIGAVPHTEWLDGVVELDAHGFVVTGRNEADWLETSMPGTYAAGDIRAGSVKRVAAAVGEGSTAAMLTLESLARSSEPR